MEAHTALEHAQSPVEELLQSRFAFADPRGVVTRWGTGAEILFGIPSDQIVGKSLFQIALGGEDGGWRAFLVGEEPHAPASRLEFSITRGMGGDLIPCEVHLVPVLLSDGLDFSQFAADLNLSNTRALEAFRVRHARVLGVIDAAAREGAEYAEGERLAGLIAIFRSTAAAPGSPDERIDEALSRAEHADRELHDLREPLMRAVAELGELRAGLDGLRERVEAIEAGSSGSIDPHALAAELEGSIAERVEEAIAARVEEALPARIDEALTGRLAEAIGTRIDEAVAARIDAAVAGRTDAAAGAAIEQALGGRLDAALGHHIDEALSGRIDESVSHRIADVLPGRIEKAVAVRLDEALDAAREAREEAEQLGRELRADRANGPRALPVGFYSPDPHPAPPERPPLPGFDDVDTPLATLSLEGRFIHLNGGFRDLIGYTEEEFASARWPSVADPDHLQQYREVRRALAAGERDEEPIETAYMHREGLLVPLSGRMSVVRGQDDEPDHLLFSVDAA